jgi:prevent-host-death family protein
MKSVGSRELKNRLGSYLRQVRDGATILVTDRGRPIAELRPLAPVGGSEAAALASLAADGLVSPPSRSRLADGYRRLAIEGDSLSAAVIEGRRDRL